MNQLQSVWNVISSVRYRRPDVRNKYHQKISLEYAISGKIELNSLESSWNWVKLN